MKATDKRWQFFVDRGGTFTDVVAIAPDGSRHVRKLLSDDGTSEDAAVRAMRELTGLAHPGPAVAGVRMGTTVATNALLERRGVPTCLAITRGFGDALVIGLQDRPELFALRIVKPVPLHDVVVEIDERVLADGTVRRAPDPERIRHDLQAAHDAGARSLAVVLVHGFAVPAHERLVASLGREVGFEHVSVSSEVAPEAGLVARGDTTVVDAAVTPLVLRHVHRMREQLGPDCDVRVMQSHGGLVRADAVRGKDTILSGPAGGVVAMARVASAAGLTQVIGFDMGGTSTDVSRWSARDGFERRFETRVAGVRLRTPMLDVVTVAAGGGSILDHAFGRLTVGPRSAGASPGPACYRNGGPATVTDANIVLGRLQPEWFPRCFGPAANEPIDPAASRARIAAVADAVGLGVEETAAGCIRIANENMAQAMHQLSVARGRDPRDHALACYGGAGGQHACALAESLGITSVLVHPLAGVLSALGMGLADVVRSFTEPVLAPLDDASLARVEQRVREREIEARRELTREGFATSQQRTEPSVDLRYVGVEAALNVPLPRDADTASLRAELERVHRELFGFGKPAHPIEVVALRLDTVGALDRPAEPPPPQRSTPATPLAHVETWLVPADEPEGRPQPRPTPVYARERLGSEDVIEGPALIVEPASTIVVDEGWSSRLDERGNLRLERSATAARAVVISKVEHSTTSDPVRLEVFGNLFMSIAEQMGEALRRVSHSTNIKERLDYSCAVFTADGRLVANAPHVPVHLGAMGETVRALLASRGALGMRPGLVLASNDPFHGGSHLPDITVVTPVFAGERLAFFVANRGHHADVGGSVPGSMPPFARSIDEEGVCFHDLTLVQDARFETDAVVRALTEVPFPVRDVGERLADLRAQAAANAVGARLLERLADERGLDVVAAFMRHVQDDAAQATRELLASLPRGTHRFADAMDDGTRVEVAITIGDGRATFDFTGTGPCHAGNLNAPRAVTTAAVLYVVRCLVGRPIPLNAGCLDPIEIVIPAGTLLSPEPPAAVAGGNVETSMRVADVLLGALDALAASQGTMNNVTFGDDHFGYYETICGGAGAGCGFEGASAVHSHLTNTRITDVEVLERRYPVVLREFSVRRGSGGDGRWRGGDGAVRAIEFLRPMRAAILSERRDRAPFGLAGGSPGSCGRNTLRRADGRVERLGGKAAVEVGAGDVLIIETPGGGGYGEPA